MLPSLLVRISWTGYKVRCSRVQCPGKSFSSDFKSWSIPYIPSPCMESCASWAWNERTSYMGKWQHRARSTPIAKTEPLSPVGSYQSSAFHHQWAGYRLEDSESFRMRWSGINQSAAFKFPHVWPVVPTHATLQLGLFSRGYDFDFSTLWPLIYLEETDYSRHTNGLEKVDQSK